MIITHMVISGFRMKLPCMLCSSSSSSSSNSSSSSSRSSTVINDNQ